MGQAVLPLQGCAERPQLWLRLPLCKKRRRASEIAHPRFGVPRSGFDKLLASMALADPLALVGTTVSEKYEIEQVVGEGGFAIVYRAMHKVWHRPVAIKVFRALGDL